MTTNSLVLFFPSFLFFNFSFGQTMQGTVEDAASGEPLPYVNIGVWNKNIGTISHDDGSFQIDVSNATEDDSLTFFSMMGYETKQISISKVKGKKLRFFSWVKPINQLREVVGYESGGTYYREVSHGEWTLNKRPPISMYLSVVEY